MFVQRLLRADSGFPCIFVAPLGLVIMADKNAGLFGEREELLDRVPQGFGRTARKIAARCAKIGHEQRIADKGRVPDDIGQTGGCVAGRVQDLGPHLPDHQAVALGKQLVELAAIALKASAFVEDLSKGVLHHGDPLADPDLATQRLLDIGRGGEMVGVDMGFQHPFQPQIIFADERDHGIGRAGVGAPRGVVEIQNGIDHRAGPALGLLHDIGDGVGGLVEKGVNLGGHGALRVRLLGAKLGRTRLHFKI